MLLRVSRASAGAADPDEPPFEGATFDAARESWTIRVSTMDELLLLARRLNETIMVDMDGPKDLQLTIFDLYTPQSPPRPSEA